MSRFWPVGIARLVFAPAVADKTAPTRPEIDAGVVLMEPGREEDEAVQSIEGWVSRNEPIETPDGDNRWVSKITGRDTTENPSITFYASDTDFDIWDALAEGTVGFLIAMWRGDVVAGRCQVWEVTVNGLNEMPTLNTEAHKFMAQFVPTQPPAKNAVIPA